MSSNVTRSLYATVCGFRPPVPTTINTRPPGSGAYVPSHVTAPFASRSTSLSVLRARASSPKEIDQDLIFSAFRKKLYNRSSTFALPTRLLERSSGSKLLHHAAHRTWHSWVGRPSSRLQPKRSFSTHLRLRQTRLQVNDESTVQHGPQINEPYGNRPGQMTSPTGPVSSLTNRNLRDRLPSISEIHKPSREELLAAATGFWARLKVRFKWFSIRSVRPFNADEIGAFFSWVLLGHVLWVILGTTTFFSLAIFAVNTVFAQETLARWVGNYLTHSSGMKVVFESAIVPKWGDGVITFKNVFISRRPGHGKGEVSKGSPAEEAAAAAAAIQTGEARSIPFPVENEEEATNYTQFDLSLNTVNVTLSFRKWFNSKGLLRDVEVRGVRGVVDRSTIHYDGEYVDPRSYRHEHNPGDFEIDSFKMEDLLVTVHQPGGFRPFSVSIFNCDLPQLRRQWLFYDILSAKVMSGSFDESLFTIHPAQAHGFVGSHPGKSLTENKGSDPWKKQSRLRIDGLNIDHLNRGVEGPFSWIYQGNVDIVANIKFPVDSDESIAKIMSEFYERIEATVTAGRHTRMPESSDIIDDDQVNGTKDNASVQHEGVLEADKGFLVLDLKVHMNDIRAAVPIFTKDLSYVNNALIRPIVAYMNSRRTFIPITCRVVKRASEFDGSWTVFDSGLMDDLSVETYQAFAKDVADDQARMRRFKKVGLWSLQLAVQAFFMGLAGNFA